MSVHMQEPTSTEGGDTSTTTPLRQRLAAAALVVGPLVLAAGSLVLPEAGEKGSTLVAAVNDSPSRWTAGHLVTIAGAALLLAGLAHLASRLPRRARTATVGLVWFALGVLGQALLSATELVIVPIAEGDATSAAATVDRISESTGLATIFALYLPGILLGGLVLFVGLRLSGVVSTPVAVLGAFAVVFGFFVGAAVPVGALVGYAALATALALAAGRPGRS